MSLDRPGKVPHPAAAWAVADLLGFWGSIDDCVGCWPEEVGGGRTAINLVQLLERPEKAPRLQAQVFELDDGATPEMRKHIPLITNATIQMTELFHTAPLPARFGIVSSFLLSVLPYSEDPAACWEAVKKRVDSLLADSIAKYEGMHAPAVAQNGETTP